MEILEHPEVCPSLPKREPSTICLRLCHFPFFRLYRTWTILKHNETTYLRRIVWAQKSVLPEPTTYASEVEIANDIYNKIMNKLSSVKIPPFAPRSILALDGETFHIECGDHHCFSKLQWWCDAPSEWKQLEAWFHKTVSYFESVLPACTVDIEK